MTSNFGGLYCFLTTIILTVAVVIVDGVFEGRVTDVISANVDMIEVTNGCKKWYFPHLKSLNVVFDFNSGKLLVEKDKLDGVRFNED